MGRWKPAEAANAGSWCRGFEVPARTGETDDICLGDRAHRARAGPGVHAGLDRPRRSIEALRDVTRRHGHAVPLSMRTSNWRTATAPSLSTYSVSRVTR